MGDTNYYESLSSHFDQPRISLFFDDLTPASAGGYGGDIYSEMKGTTGAADERLVVTFDGVSQYGTDDGGCYGQARGVPRVVAHRRASSRVVARALRSRRGRTRCAFPRLSGGRRRGFQWAAGARDDVLSVRAAVCSFVRLSAV